MTDDRWARIDTILQAALVRPADARELFVRDACGDDAALRDEVMSLLAHAASADGFLELTPSEAGKRLEPGETLGPYSINQWIGAGGMGEVYRARDPRLGRDVAIKILPSALAVDPDRLRRFEQEARAAAALNHPNIVTIHSVEQAGDVHFLTMELVEGTPLSDRIPHDGLPLDRLLRSPFHSLTRSALRTPAASSTAILSLRT